MRLIDRWAQDHVFFYIEPATGEQFKVDLNDSSDDMTPLEPDSPHWDHSYDALFYKFHPEAGEKFKKQYEEFKEKSAGGTGRSCPWRR